MNNAPLPKAAQCQGMDREIIRLTSPLGKDGSHPVRDAHLLHQSSRDVPISSRWILAIEARASELAFNQCKISASITRLGFDKCRAQSSSKAAKVLLSKR
jgi:hypothetical protein